MRRTAAWPAALLAIACGHGGASPTPPAAAMTVRVETAHFRVLTDAVPDDVLRGTAFRLEQERGRVMSDLAVAAVRPITVKVWQDAPAWAAEVQRYFGRRIDTDGYVTGPDEIRLLRVAALETNATHEMSHCVSLYVDPSFANNPRWLWETVALFENGEWVDPRRLEYMAGGRPPTLQELDLDVTAGRRVYEVGYVLGEFIVARAGRAGLVSLIMARGDTAAVLGLSPSEFQAAWYAFVRDRYLG
jgi:hypothetical protein